MIRPLFLDSDAQRGYSTCRAEWDTIAGVKSVRPKDPSDADRRARAASEEFWL
jgi:hypothetical protein